MQGFYAADSDSVYHLGCPHLCSLVTLLHKNNNSNSNQNKRSQQKNLGLLNLLLSFLWILDFIRVCSDRSSGVEAPNPSRR